MADEDFICADHSGCLERLNYLEGNEKELWTAMHKQEDRINSIFMRLNITICGVAVSCILLALNLLVK